MLLDHINTLEELESECLLHEQVINLTCSEQPEEALQHGNDLTVIIARTGKMMADAQYHRDNAISNAIEKTVETGMSDRLSASALTKYVNSCTSTENFIYTWIERIHRTAEKQLDWTRTIISYAKEEMRLSR